MTKMMSAHSTCSDESSTFAPLEMPAESVSIPGQVEKICSAVGLRRRLALQTKRTLVTLSLSNGDGTLESTSSQSPHSWRPLTHSTVQGRIFTRTQLSKPIARSVNRAAVRLRLAVARDQS